MVRSRFRNISHFIKRTGFYLPFTIYFLLFAVAVGAGYSWLKRSAAIPDSSYKDIFKLLLSLVLLIGSAILCLGVFSVCFAFVYFRWKQRRVGTTVRVATLPHKEHGLQEVFLLIDPILRPLLGYIRIRLRYDTMHYSKKFDVISRNTGKLINTTLEGVYHWDLPEIREYRIEQVLIYFEDFFQFFSFAVGLPANNSFYTPPKTQSLSDITTFPRKTEDQTVRIEELKKIEGEYINYKNFENSDDVRRIVWKIYAKNKELVVRIPEILDPYASHIYFYPSFYSKFKTGGNAVLEVPFLNYYKTVCWSLYRQFVKKGFEVRYIPDQPIPQQGQGEEDRVKYSITCSSWQQDLDLKGYVSVKDAAIVLVSSLSDPGQVKEMSERYGDSITFAFLKLSESTDNLDLRHWLQWLFIQQEENKSAAYRSAWRLSALRWQIEQNEKQLSEILKHHQAPALQ